MENASKALIMAASILIGIMVVSFAVYIFSLFGDFAYNVESNREAQQLESFNSNFSKYKGLTDISPHDIVSVINMAQENNKKYGYSKSDASSVSNNDSYIKVNIAGIAGKPEWWDEDEIATFLTDNMLNNLDDSNKEILSRFTCTDVKYGEASKRVYEIDFKKN